MKLLLDAHISGRHVGGPLRDDVHDVLAVDSEPGLKRAPDERLLEIALSERRIVVTSDTGDFNRLLRRPLMVELGHSGVILIPGKIRNAAYGALLSLIRHELEGTSDDDWVDRVVWLKRPRE